MYTFEKKISVKVSMITYTCIFLSKKAFIMKLNVDTHFLIPNHKLKSLTDLTGDILETLSPVLHLRRRPMYVVFLLYCKRCSVIDRDQHFTV